MTKETKTNKNLEELCIYKRTCGETQEDKSYCALSCNGYDKLCKSYKSSLYKILNGVTND